VRHKRRDLLPYPCKSSPSLRCRKNAGQRWRQRNRDSLSSSLRQAACYNWEAEGPERAGFGPVPFGRML
jgi:hypothetical protein